MERLFDLDLQLIADSAFTAVNVLILFIIASYLFFDPVRNFLQSRQSRIKNDLATADMEKNQAMQMKAEYEAKLKEINKEAEEILSDARKKAMKNEARIVEEAKAEAARIMDQLCEAGVVGPEEGTKPRKILMSSDEFEKYIEECL